MKLKLKKVKIIAFCMMLIIGILSSSYKMNVQAGNSAERITPRDISEQEIYLAAPSIVVYGNADFHTQASGQWDQGGAATGTISDPYVIENLAISGPGELITIVGTDLHFRIDTCILMGGSLGILLINVTNAIIVNNNISSNSVGILLNTSYVNTIQSNIISGSSDHGIHLIYSSNTNITLNTISNNAHSGVSFAPGSNNNELTYNDFYFNDLTSISQVSDFGVKNKIYCNYWNDWTSPDADNDGIVDVPYTIFNYNEDPYPLEEPVAAAGIPANCGSCLPVTVTEECNYSTITVTEECNYSTITLILLTCIAMVVPLRLKKARNR